MGEVLTEAQVVALERKQDDDAAHGEIETAHSVFRKPGYFLLRHIEGRRPCLLANLCRYIL